MIRSALAFTVALPLAIRWVFVHRANFEAMGDFPDQPVMEDIELWTRPHGVWRTIGLIWYLRWRYWLGQSPEQLVRAYQ